jgi:DNA repair protein RadC
MKPGNVLRVSDSAIPGPSFVRSLRRKVTSEGIEGLGDVDLLALVLGGERASVHAAEALTAAGDLVSLAEGRGASTLSKDGGARIAASVELGRRVACARATMARERFHAPAPIAAWGAAKLGDLAHEELWLLSLDNRHGLVGARQVGRGGSRSVCIGVADVLRIALRLGGPSFVLVHNHPSGDPTPSEDDVILTRKVEIGATAAGLTLVDHVVIGRGGHVSLFANGLMGES